MKNNNLKTILFVLGSACIIFACILLFKPVKPDSFKTKSVFELGILTDQIGNVSIIREKENIPTKSGFKVYSNDTVVLTKDSEVSLNIGDEKLSILGPADFNIAFPKKDARDVFLNFKTFTKTEVLDKAPENIWVIYKNWYVEPGFGVEATEAKNYKNIKLPEESKSLKSEKNEEDKKALAENELNKSLSIEDQEAALEEAIGVKRPLLKRCYENYLKKNPQATGDLTVEFTVQNSGNVSASKIAESSFINDSLFKTCIRNVFRKVKTRPFDGEPLAVSYPISFE